MFNRILVPLDGSPQSAAALPLARTIAHVSSGTVELVRVVPSFSEATVRRDAHVYLSRIGEELAAGNVRVAVTVREGDPATEILAQAETAAADLIVMATHGRSGVARAVLGSVAQQVLSGSPIPMLLLRPGGKRVAHVGTLLVPVDGSPESATALGVAVGLARQTSARVVLVQAVSSVLQYALDPLGGFSYVDPQWDEDALAAAKAYVEALAGRLRKAEFTVDGSVELGDPADVIARQAEGADADLIVMATHARTGAARTILGSVADATVRTAKRPVLLVRVAPVSARASADTRRPAM
jgi:nucleotide-binding universal stress UspA family protein